MPELPEVQTVVSTLRPLVIGRVLRSVRTIRQDIVSPGIDLALLLAGRRVVDITRRAKRIIFLLDDGNRFYIHLGMTGRLTVAPAAAIVEKHTHLIVDLEEGTEDNETGGQGDKETRRVGVLAHDPNDEVKDGSERREARTEKKDAIDSFSRHPRGSASPAPTSALNTQNSALSFQLRFRDPRRFGGIFWLGQSGTGDEDLGPEPLSLRPEELTRRLSTTTRAIKAALLDQSLIAGLGNIYADEALFAAGIHPLTPARELSPEQVAALNRGIKKVLRQAIRFRGSTLRDFVDATGATGSYRDKHLVYDRDGQPCPRCRSAKIHRIIVAGRSTCFCPVCQPKRKPRRR